jgi:mRNA interferase MazF
MGKEFDRWNEKKKVLNRVEFDDYVHEREVWWCALGLNVGVEADGKNKDFERPVLVLRKFNRDSVLIVPLSSRVKDNQYHVQFQHEGETAAAVISQIRLVSTKRLLRRMYRMDSGIFDTIQRAVLVSIQNRPPLSRGPRGPHGHKYSQ